MCTRPTGLVSVAPKGPAMPVTPTPTVAPVRGANALGERFGYFGGDSAVRAINSAGTPASEVLSSSE